MNKILAFLLIFTVLPFSVEAENITYPVKPVKMVIPWGTGGAIDSTTRFVADKLSARLNQNFIVENKPGMGGILGMKYFVNATSDGYTLAVNTNNLVAASEIYKSDLYNWRTDMVPIASFNYVPLAIFVKNDSPIKTFQNFIDEARKNPDKVSVADAGIGSNNNITLELISNYANVKFLQVHYASTNQATNDLIGGFVDAKVDSLAGMMPFVKSGKVRILAITGKNRSEFFPDIPSIQELNINGFDGFSYYGENYLFGPKNLDPKIITFLNRTVNEILDDPEIKEKFKNLGLTPEKLTPEEVKNRLIKTENEIVPLIKKLNISVK